jgi:hypothetical protein
MASRKQSSATLRDASISNYTRETTSKRLYDREQRRSLPRKAWTEGFLTSNGIQIPLFIRPAQQLK